jgi:CubicO group peptidase (beta-lactamase class C family)
MVKRTGKSRGGLSTARLARMREVMSGYVARGEIPGLVTLVSRRGEVRADAIGVMAAGGTAPIARDTIFRITSMTKPITAAAAMILVEDCKLRLDEPVDRLLPELANRRVLRRIDGPLDDTVRAHRPITVRDVLTFRLGFGQPYGPLDATPIQKAANAAGLSLGPPSPPSPHAPDEWMRRLGALPLMAQPGETWLYGTGAHVLGVLIARAAGQPLETFLRERLLGPLGMKDTAFSVPPDKVARLPVCYATDPWTGGLTVFDGARDGQWTRAPAFPDASAGLVSTVDDVHAFARMMLAKGRHGRGRILSRPSVEAMTTDQLTPEQRAAAVGFLGENRGWGFGTAVVVRRDDLSAVPGRFGWDGGYGTSFAVDPAEEMIGILMTQRMWTSPSPPAVCRDFWTSAYAAIDD